MKVTDASARLGTILALFAGTVRLLRWFEIIGPLDVPPTALGNIDLMGILGCCVVIVSLGAAAGRPAVAITQQWRLRRDLRAQGLFHLHRIEGEPLDSLFYQFRHGDRRILGDRDNYVLSNLRELFLIERANNGQLSSTRNRSYVIPDHIWRELQALNEKHQKRTLPDKLPWQKYLNQRF